MAQRYKLKLTALKFVSAVDMPAQETATVAIIKRAGAELADLNGTFAVAKLDESLGIVMGFALTTTVDGKAYFDVQGDAIQDEDLVKVAADFMSAGGPTDEMHDEQQDGRALFCWPLTAEIAKSLDIKTSKTGLLVGIKPSADVLAKFKSGEYTGFSIGGVGVREAVKSQVRCRKCSQYMAKGLTQCPGCGAEPMTDDEPQKRATTINVVDSRAALANSLGLISHKSTHRAGGANVNSQPEPTMPTEHEIQIADLTKRNAVLERIAKLSGAQKAHYDSLVGEAADTFLAKSAEDRDAIVMAVVKAKSDANEVEYTSPVDGTIYRKSDDPRLVAMAKREAAARDTVMQERLEKRASVELSHFAKSVSARATLLKAVDGIADEKVRGEVVEMLKGANVAMRDAGIAKGANPGEDAASPLATFNKALGEFAKSVNKPVPQATGDFLRTEHGAELYAAVNASLTAQN